MEENKVLHLVSHTHWDREWYKTFQQFRWRYVKLMDHLLDLFEENDEYKYFTMDGQILVLYDYLEIRPEKKEQIEKYIKEGCLLIGPFYSQPNEFMVSGEALIRNLLLGYREGEKFGRNMDVCYLPDAFGHISQLPQIVKGFDMEDIVIWRGLPRDAKTVFNWHGADGSQCKVFYMYQSYGLARALPLSEESYTETIDGIPVTREGLSERINSILDTLAPRTTSPHLLLMNGIDHAFAQDDLPQVIEKINKEFAGITAQHSDLPEYIKQVRHYHQKNQIDYQQFQGELRDPSESSILTGSQSTRSDVKMYNNKIEGLLEKWMEPFATFAWLLRGDYPYAQIWKTWEYLLQNHSHDSLACSSLDQTYHQVMTRFEWAAELGQEIINESLQVICNQIDDDNDGIQMTVFNPLNWQRSEVITTTLDIPKAMEIENPVLRDQDKNVPMIILEKRDNEIIKYNPRQGIPDNIPVDRYEVSFKVNNIPATGYKSLKLVDNKKPVCWQGSLIKSNCIMENNYLRVKINSNGTLDICDKQSHTEYSSLHIFEDNGEAGEGFFHQAPVNDDIIYSTGSAAEITVVEDNLLKATFKVDITINLPEQLTSDRQNRSQEKVPCKISSLITLNAGSPRIDIKTKVDNQAKDHRLRVTFPTKINTDFSYAKQPFDVVKRKVALPDLNDYSGDKPKSFHPQQSFVDVTDGTKGLMIANQGLYEYEVKDNEDRSIAITLLRCTDKLHRGYLFRSEATQIPEAQCIGDYTFSYSIIPHQGDWKSAYREAYNFKFPLKTVRRQSLEEETLSNFEEVKYDNKLPEANAFVEIEPESLVLAAVKKHENNDAMVIRVNNLSEETVTGNIKLNLPGKQMTRVYRINLKEERLNELPVANGELVQVEVKKKEIFTLEILLS